MMVTDENSPTSYYSTNGTIKTPMQVPRNGAFQEDQTRSFFVDTSSVGGLSKKIKNCSPAVQGVGPLLSITYDANEGSWSRCKIHKSTLKAISKLQSQFFKKKVVLRFVSIVGPRTEESGKSTLLNMLWSSGAKMHNDLLLYADKLDSGMMPSLGSPLRAIRKSNLYDDVLLKNQCTHCLGSCGANNMTLSVDCWLSPCPISGSNEMCLVLDMPGYHPGCWYRERADTSDSLAIAALGKAEMKHSASRLVCDCQCALNMCMAHQKLLQLVVSLSSSLLVNLPSNNINHKLPSNVSETSMLPDIENCEHLFRPLVAAVLANRGSSSTSAHNVPYIHFYLRDSWAISARSWKIALERSDNPVVQLMMNLFHRFSTTVLPPLPEPFLKAMRAVSAWPKTDTALASRRDSLLPHRSFAEEAYDLKFACHSLISGDHTMGRWTSFPNRFWTNITQNVSKTVRIPVDAIGPLLNLCANAIETTTEHLDRTLYYIPFIKPDELNTNSMTGLIATSISLPVQNLLIESIETELDSICFRERANFRNVLLRRTLRIAICSDANGNDNLIDELTVLGWSCKSPAIRITKLDARDFLILKDMCLNESLDSMRESVALLVSCVLSGRNALDLLEGLADQLWTEMRQDCDDLWKLIQQHLIDSDVLMAQELTKYLNQLNLKLFKKDGNHQIQSVIEAYLANSVGVDRYIIPASIPRLDNHFGLTKKDDSMMPTTVERQRHVEEIN
eukprot:GHVH01009490.1.p1 GENE.GHVH01009490.1~~GHVH01009490.1.p1  ORF type:complete len:732 (+),score=48.17 GHVH01009490.1:131-2326(+)